MITEASLTAKIFFNSFNLIISALLVYLGLDGEAFLLFSILLFIDYVTGVMKARTLNHSITSNKMKYGIISKFSLMFIPIVLAIGAKALDADFSSVLLVGINILVLSEVYSIIGNIYTVRTKEELPEYDAVAAVGKKIRTTLIKASDA